MSKELFDKRFVYFMWDDKLEGKKGFVYENIQDLKRAVNGSQAGIETNVRKADDDIFVSSTNNRRYNFFYYDPNYQWKRAYAEGKQLQLSFNGTTWIDIESDWKIGDFDATPADYRIKPEQDACVVLKQVDGVLTLCWNFAKDERNESRHIYFQGTVSECLDYIDSHNKFTSLMKAWEEGKQIQFKLLSGKWSDLVNPQWSNKYEYRINPKELKLRRMFYRELSEWLAKGNGQYVHTDNVNVRRINFEYQNEVDDLEISDVYKIRRWGSDEWIEPTVDIYLGDCKK